MFEFVVPASKSIGVSQSVWSVRIWRNEREECKKDWAHQNSAMQTWYEYEIATAAIAET